MVDKLLSCDMVRHLVHSAVDVLFDSVTSTRHVPKTPLRFLGEQPADWAMPHQIRDLTGYRC